MLELMDEGCNDGMTPIDMVQSPFASFLLFQRMEMTDTL